MTSSSTAPSGSDLTTRYEALDGVRGYAALTVIVYHCLLALDPQIWHKFDKTSILEVGSFNDFLSKLALNAFNGDAAVIVFFILSGFVLGRSLERDFSRYTPQSAISAFIVRRVLRLYPAFFVALIGTIAILASAFWLFSIPLSSFYFGPINLLRNALLINPEISGITWSILIEFAVLPYLVVFGYLAFRTGYFAVIVFILMSAAARYFPIITLYYLKFHLYILCFALGLLMCTPFGAGIGRGLVRVNKTVLFAAFLSVSLFVSASALQIVLGYLWISSLLFAQDRWTWFLTRPSSLYFGRISYGLYLWHYPFAIAAYTPFALYAPWALGSHAIWYGLLTAPLIIPVTIMLAHASERWIERPFIDLGYRVSRRLVRPRNP